jgi:putative transposase
VVGWALDSQLKTSLALEALRLAYWRQKPAKGLIHHSDRGSQYAAHDYQQALKTFGMIPSMSRKGLHECRSRKPATFKNDQLGTRFTDREEARCAVIDYIEMFYNSRRLHSFLGYATPNDFEEYFTLATVA